VARIRSAKPELRRDLTVAEWPREVRYAWVLLWGYLDDHGRGHDDMRLVCADLFPLDRDVTDRKMDRWLTLMSTTSVAPGKPVLCRYTVDGRSYLHAPKWDRSQRVSHPQPSLIPACPTHEPLPKTSGTVLESVPNDPGGAPEPFRPSHAGEVKGLGVKGSRGQGSKGPFGEPASAGPPDAGTVVAAYIEGAENASLPRPGPSLIGQIGKQAKAMLATNDHGTLVAAARTCGATGWSNLATQVQRDAVARKQQTRGPMDYVEVAPRQW